MASTAFPSFSLGTECALHSVKQRGEIHARWKDRFGEKMTLVRRARENIYFAEKDRRLIKRL
jgi:hypothetical protein